MLSGSNTKHAHTWGIQGFSEHGIWCEFSKTNKMGSKCSIVAACRQSLDSAQGLREKQDVPRERRSNVRDVVPSVISLGLSNVLTEKKVWLYRIKKTPSLFLLIAVWQHAFPSVPWDTLNTAPSSAWFQTYLGPSKVCVRHEDDGWASLFLSLKDRDSLPLNFRREWHGTVPPGMWSALCTTYLSTTRNSSFSWLFIISP